MQLKSVAVTLVFFLSLSVMKAQYIIRGKIFEADNKEALPFVPVLIKNTNAAIQSDFDGNFILKSYFLGDSLVASYVGYKRLARAINKSLKVQELNFPLEKSGGVSLDEILIASGENPAHRILKNCINFKEKNNKNELISYEYETYNKLEFDLTRISEKMQNRKAFKPISFIFDNVDSSFSSEKPSLPFFIVESLSQFYFKSNPTRKKEIILASKITGIENSSISQVMGDMYQNINIYNNNILLFNKQLPSPVSENGLFYYKYFLQDSSFDGKHYLYHLTFKPKRVQELSFTGNIWIADTSWGIKRLEMSLPKDANINFINSANVIQEFVYADSSWMLHKDRLVIDFAPTKNSVGFYGRKTTSYKKIKINQPKEDLFYQFVDKINLNEGALKQTEEFWAQNRHDSLTQREKKIFKMIDTIRSLPIYKTWIDVFHLVLTGYKRLNNFEIGPYFNLISYNKIEGTRIRIGGRTSNVFSKWYQLSGYFAYGLSDQNWKQSLGIKSFLTQSPKRQIVGVNYSSDYEILGQNSNGFSQDNVLASFFRTDPLIHFTLVNSVTAFYESEWFPGFITKVSFIGRSFKELGENKYTRYKRDGGIEELEKLNNTEIRFNFRFAWKEKYISTGFRRLSLGTKYPIFQLNYSKSLLDAYKGEYDYQKLVLNVSDRIRIAPILGYTDFTFEVGKIWGALPYPLMELHGGNQTYIYDKLSFNMMKNYEFVSDQFISATIFHHFEGLFLNKIPFLRKLKWREVTTAKAVWGSVNQQNRNTLIFPSTLKALDKGPYIEASAGIENIFKLFRIDAFWRLNYKLPNAFDNFGLKFGFQLTL